jgi:protein-tyrosine phosphatase
MRPWPPAGTFWIPIGDGAVLAGEHPVIAEEGVESRIRRLVRVGVTRIVDLSSSQDWMPPYREFLASVDPGVTYTRYEIIDRRLPEDLPRLQTILRKAIADAERGEITFFHCQAGVGRTGTVIGCLLRELGCGPQEALDELVRLRGEVGLHEGSPEFEEQREYVRNWPTGSRRPAGTSGGSARG